MSPVDILQVARVNAVIVGNYLTTLGWPAEHDLTMLAGLKMPIKALAKRL